MRRPGQPDLFEQLQPAPFVYRDGPGHRGVDTSIGAATSIRSDVSRQQNVILAFLHECASRGATYTEVMDGTLLTAGSVCGRMNELVDAKLVTIHGTRPSASRRPCRVYMLPRFVPPKATA